MNTLSLSQLASISDLQRDYNSLVEKAKKFAQPLVLLRRNQPEAILLSVDAYEDLVANKQLYEEKMALEAIASFEKDKKAGKLMVAKKAEDLFK